MKFDVTVDVSFVYRIEAEDEDEVRAYVNDGGLDDRDIIEVYSGPDVWKIEEVRS